jgi:hypothetical protein
MSGQVSDPLMKQATALSLINDAPGPAGRLSLRYDWGFWPAIIEMSNVLWRRNWKESPVNAN